MVERDITLSVVSHAQNALVNQVLDDLRQHCPDRICVLITQNVPDPTPLAIANLPFPVEVITNSGIKGFGANHNAAFAYCQTPFFCVANPDIRLPGDPFPALVAALTDDCVGAAGPLVRSPSGTVEDSARRFPTVARLLMKAFRDTQRPDYPADCGPQHVDWIAGMFMLFRAEAFRTVGGFDEAYFLYYEDVDLCRRMYAVGNRVLYVPAAEVVHDARRASRRDPHLALRHLRSATRFLARR